MTVVDIKRAIEGLEDDVEVKVINEDAPLKAAYDVKEVFTKSVQEHYEEEGFALDEGRDYTTNTVYIVTPSRHK